MTLVSVQLSNGECPYLYLSTAIDVGALTYALFTQGMLNVLQLRGTLQDFCKED